ncbi:MAG TPA: AAA family ATPase [Terriglobia bacterium]|nr:AAA family ATPase [Terriglobia bacterium]
MEAQAATKNIVLEPEKRSIEVLRFERELRSRIVGQDEAISQLVSAYQIVMAGMASPGRPIANLLLLGPTGSGKTRLIEAAAEILFGTADAVVKIDCAEFQHSHEISKLIGSPPGYIGHRETPPTLTQERLNAYHTEKLKLTFVLFDEIEKGNETLWELLLGILDKGTLTLGDNRKVDFSHTIVCMTSNLGATEMMRLSEGGIGFAPRSSAAGQPQIDKKIYRVAVDAARRKFSPEFMNRIDKVIVFRTLNREHLRSIVDIELGFVQKRILASDPERIFDFVCTNAAKEFLLNAGTDPKYGARHLKRAIERFVVFPLSSLMATGQVMTGDIVNIDVSADGQSLVFTKEQHEPDGPPAEASPPADVIPSQSFMWRAVGRY